MNDLRSRNRGLAAVPDESTVITATPPRVRPESDDSSQQRMSPRQSIVERAQGLDRAPADRNDHKFKSSRPVAPVAEADDDSSSEQAEAEETKDGVSSRPSRRRDVAEDEPAEEDKFPWHFQFDDDEPEELQASSPLLSRAFRATIG